MNTRLSRVCDHVDDVDTMAAQARQDHVTAMALRISIATGASVPSRMVQLVTNMQHVGAMQHLEVTI